MLGVPHNPDTYYHQEPSAVLPDQGSVARPEMRGPGMLLLGAEP